jgi:hypothetical protein
LWLREEREIYRLLLKEQGYVILPMVLKIRKTMVLQRIEREGKGRPPHF